MTGSTLSRSVTSRFHISRSIALVRPVLLHQALVVGRVPRLEDHRAQLEALDQDAALVVHREVRGPDHALAAALRSHACAASSSEPSTSGSSSNSTKPNQPQFALCCSLKARLICARDAAHHAPVPPREEVGGLAVAEEGVHAPVEEHVALDLQRWHPVGVVRVQAEGEVDEGLQVPPAGCFSDLYSHCAGTLHAHHPRRLRQGPPPRALGAARCGARGGHPALLPRAHIPGDAGRGDGGRAADHAGLQQLPRAHRRRARAGGRAGRAAPLRHRPHRLAPA